MTVVSFKKMPDMKLLIILIIKKTASVKHNKERLALLKSRHNIYFRLLFSLGAVKVVLVTYLIPISASL